MHENLISTLRSISDFVPTTDDAAFEAKIKRDKNGKFAHFASQSELAALGRGDDPGGNYKPVDENDLPTLSAPTKSKYRGIRNSVKREIDAKLASNPNADDAMGTYDVSSGKPVRVNLTDGYQVSLQTTGGEGYGGTHAVSDEEYDKTVDEICQKTGSKPFVGYYGGIPEISFHCKSLKEAMDIGNKYAQHTVCNNELASQGVFTENTFLFCEDGYSHERNPLYKYVNPRRK